jgi:hypothetical protein
MSREADVRMGQEGTWVIRSIEGTPSRYDVKLATQAQRDRLIKLAKRVAAVGGRRRGQG